MKTVTTLLIFLFCLPAFAEMRVLDDLTKRCVRGSFQEQYSDPFNLNPAWISYKVCEGDVVTYDQPLEVGEDGKPIPRERASEFIVGHKYHIPEIKIGKVIWVDEDKEATPPFEGAQPYHNVVILPMELDPSTGELSLITATKENFVFKSLTSNLSGHDYSDIFRNQECENVGNGFDSRYNDQHKLVEEVICVGDTATFNEDGSYKRGTVHKVFGSGYAIIERDYFPTKPRFTSFILVKVVNNHLYKQ